MKNQLVSQMDVATVATSNRPISNLAPIVKLQFSRHESAEILGLSLRTLDRLIHEKQLPARRTGRRVLITSDALVNYTRQDHTTETIQ